MESEWAGLSSMSVQIYVLPAGAKVRMATKTEGSTCKNVVTEVRYEVLVDPPGLIAAVGVSFKQTTMRVAIPTALRQTHAIKFFRPSNVPDDTGDTVLMPITDTYQRSGNPGYIRVCRSFLGV